MWAASLATHTPARQTFRGPRHLGSKRRSIIWAPRSPASLRQRSPLSPLEIEMTAEPLSSARQLLADRQNALARVDTAVASQLALAAKLDHVHAALPLAKAALATFDSESAAGYANWASGRVTGKPANAGAQRAELVAEVADADAASTAATAAQERFRKAAIAAEAPAERLKADIRNAVTLVVIDDATERLLPKVRAAFTAAEDAHRELLAAAGVIASSMAGDVSGDVSPAFQIFGDARRAATAKQPEPAESPYLAGYKKLQTALHGDATVSFDDAQSLDLPGAGLALPAYDAQAQMQAEVAAIMSFRTTSLT
jgi:hypothetical protein